MWILEWIGKILMAGAFGLGMWWVLYNFLAKPFARWIDWRHEVEKPQRDAKIAADKAKKEAKAAERKALEEATKVYVEAKAAARKAAKEAKTAKKSSPQTWKGG